MVNTPPFKKSDSYRGDSKRGGAVRKESFENIHVKGGGVHEYHFEEKETFRKKEKNL